MHGHVWTIGRRALDVVQPPAAPAAVSWSTTLTDPDVGAVRLTGQLTAVPTDAIAVIVHGLGGTAGSPYVRRFAAVAHAAGLATLRINLRGADLAGGDFYHAGLTEDLAAAMASPEVRAYRRVYLIGFSLGGHVALRYAAIAPGALRAVAALCSPLDLAATSRHLERPVAAPYRFHLLRGLRAMYAAVAATRPVAIPPAAVRAIRTLAEWDDRVVAPRFGFGGVAEYYRRMSVAPLLPALAVPAYYLGADRDPMVGRATVEPALAGASRTLTVEWLPRGGHCGFPAEAAVYRRVVDTIRLW